MKLIAKRKMPDSITKYIDKSGWPAIGVRRYVEMEALKWGVPSKKLDCPYHVYTHTRLDNLLLPAKDAYIYHCVRKSCYKDNTQRVLCIRVTRSGKTIIIREHDYGTCDRIRK